jgi:integrase
MASISTSKSGGYRTIQFINRDKKRKTIRLGSVPMKFAEEVCLRVERLNAAQVMNTSLDEETARWVAGLAGTWADKLAAVGLIPKRRAPAAGTLGEWLKSYREMRADVAPRTSSGFRGTSNRLLDFFPAGKALRDLTEGDVDRWVIWLKTKYSGATVSKSVKLARQFWAQAIRDGMATANPFTHVRTPSEVNTARAFFVERATFDIALAACPDHEWRLLLALARYGGLRTPSEPLRLEWPDVNWERNRFRMVSPKTRRHDGGERWVPLFPELRPYLEEAFEKAKPGALHVVTRWRNSEKNLRTGFLRILRKAGIKAWPRLFQNLRASRETELAEIFPIHAVAEWLGNSAKTALMHYTVVTEDLYQRAAKSAAPALQNPVQQPAAKSRTASQESTQGQAYCGLVREDAI